MRVVDRNNNKRKTTAWGRNKLLIRHANRLKTKPIKIKTQTHHNSMFKVQKRTLWKSLIKSIT
jgi:hypothetical protein